MTPQDKFLKLLADNPPLLDAVKTKIVQQFDTPNLELSLTNEQLGERVRARLDGLRRVEEGFAQIARLKTAENVTTTHNPAR